MHSAEEENIALRVLDNSFSPEAILRNAHTLIEERVDLVVEHQADERFIAEVADLYLESNIPMIAVHAPHPGATYSGPDNYRGGLMSGRYLGKWAKIRRQGQVDLVLLLEDPKAGLFPRSRLNGYADFEKRLVSVRKFLHRLPRPGRTLIFGIDDPASIGAVRAFEESGLGRDWAAAGFGGSYEARAEMRRAETEFVGSVAYFPDRYGEQVIPLAIRLLTKKPVRPAIFVKPAMITSSNVSHHYPNDILRSEFELTNLLLGGACLGANAEPGPSMRQQRDSSCRSPKQIRWRRSFSGCRRVGDVVHRQPQESKPNGRQLRFSGFLSVKPERQTLYGLSSSFGSARMTRQTVLTATDLPETPVVPAQPPKKATARGKTLGECAAWAVIALGLFPLTGGAHEVISTEITWAREISRLMDRCCLSCHHEGGAAFDLTTYEKARPWAKAIKEEVLERRMPPWGAVKGFAEYLNDGALPQEEITLFAKWVEGGAPEGEDRELPKFTWETKTSAASPQVGKTVVVKKLLTPLKKETQVVGVRPAGVPNGAPLRVVARKPDGALEPLIWFDGFRSELAHDYYFLRPLNLPAKSEIRLSAEDLGGVELLTAKSLSMVERRSRSAHGDHSAPAGDLDGTIKLDAEKLEALLASGESAGLFVCPMDPDVRGDRPGKCSRCGMDLVLGIPKRLEYQVDLTTSPQAVRPAENVELSFDIRHPDSDEPLYHFQIVHEKLLHMFIVSDDLEYFLHEHPVLGEDGVFRFTTQFPMPGLYRVIADFYPQGGAPQITAKTVMVSQAPGDVRLEPASIEPDVGARTTENLKVELVTEPAAPIAGLKTLMHFRLTPTDGLEPYLGAWGHMLAASEDLIDLIHNHPFLAYEDDGRVQFNMIFPRPGTYRVWVQFQRQGVVNTAVFDVKVIRLR